MDAKERSNQIEAVLNEVIPEIEGYEEGDILVEWIVVAYVTNPGDEEGAAAYPLIYSNGVMPYYRARGLLVTGLEYLKPSVDE